MFINKIYSCLDCKKGYFFLKVAACKAQSTGKLNFSHKSCKHHIQGKKKVCRILHRGCNPMSGQQSHRTLKTADVTIRCYRSSSADIGTQTARKVPQ